MSDPLAESIITMYQRMLGIENKLRFIILIVYEDGYWMVKDTQSEYIDMPDNEDWHIADTLQELHDSVKAQYEKTPARWWEQA